MQECSWCGRPAFFLAPLDDPPLSPLVCFILMRWRQPLPSYLWRPYSDDRSALYSRRAVGPYRHCLNLLGTPSLAGTLSHPSTSPSFGAALRSCRSCTSSPVRLLVTARSLQLCTPSCPRHYSPHVSHSSCISSLYYLPHPCACTAVVVLLLLQFFWGTPAVRVVVPDIALCHLPSLTVVAAFYPPSLSALSNFILDT